MRVRVCVRVCVCMCMYVCIHHDLTTAVCILCMYVPFVCKYYVCMYAYMYILQSTYEVKWTHICIYTVRHNIVLNKRMYV